MASVRVEMNSAGAKALLQSTEVRMDLERRGRAIAAAAGGQPDFVVETRNGAARTRVVVVTDTYEGRLAEANERALSNAIDAGRS
jgi:ubiquinone/menaquinone biosynthesis C-methylase UbiE